MPSVPPIAPPLVMTAEPTWARVPAGQRRIPIVIELTAGDSPAERERPKLSLILVVDVSGSMSGPPLEQVIRSVRRILELLGEEDRVGVVAFSSNATVVSPLATLEPVSRRAIGSRVGRLNADDQTNIEAGLRLAAAQFAQQAVPGERTAIVLLSDGEPNVGASSKEALGEIARLLRGNLSISTLGYGARHDEAILIAIAEGGGGCYRFISDPALCQLELAQAVGAQGDIAVEGVELTLVPRPGVQIDRVFGAAPPRYGAEGLLVTVPDLPANATRTVVVEVTTHLHDPVLIGGLLSVTASYRAAGSQATLTTGADVHVDVGGTSPAPNPKAYAKALLVGADVVRGEARALADRGQYEGAASLLRAHMKLIAAAPGYVQADGSTLSEAWEQLLDEAMAMERRPAREALVALKASTAMRSLAFDGSASSRPKGRLTNAMTLRLTGDFGLAWLVIMNGPDAGRRHKLGQQNTLGRTTSADVMIRSPQVSRRHADVFALEGDFFVADLGSTNVTKVNGAPIAHAPHMLKHGDLIQIGEVVIRFEKA